MMPDELYVLELNEFVNKLKGFNKHFEDGQRAAWERTRMQTWHLINIQLPQDKSISIGRLMKFPWDDEREETKPLTEEEREKMLSIFPKILPENMMPKK